MILSDLLDLNRINTRLLSKGRPLSHAGRRGKALVEEGRILERRSREAKFVAYFLEEFAAKFHQKAINLKCRNYSALSQTDVIPECFYRGSGFKTDTIFPIKTSGMTDFFIMLNSYKMSYDHSRRWGISYTGPIKPSGQRQRR